MLKNISPLFSPELLAAIYAMGHGGEIVLADAHYPVHQFNQNVIRADGLQIDDLLGAILPLFELDSYDDAPVMMMEPVPGDELDPIVEESYLSTIQKNTDLNISVKRIERFAFYDRTKLAHAIVATGDTNSYANVILKKGVTPVSA